MRRRKHEAKARFGDTVRDGIGWNVELDAQRQQNIRSSGLGRQRPVAVLGHFKAGTRRHEGGTGRNIIRARGIATGADDVDGPGRCFHPQHFLAHDFDRPGNFVYRLTAHPERHQQPADLRWRGFARHHDVEGGAGFRAAQRRAVGHLGDERFEIGHQRTLS